jgi:hypothetical protein
MLLVPKPFHVLLLLALALALPAHATDTGSTKYRSIDRIKGIGKFIFGAQLKDFPASLLQPVDPHAHGVLLKVSPYGENFLVKDLTGLTWGTIPVAGMVVTFHDGKLIDVQAALKAKKGDFYIVDRAFKEKYGPSDPKTFPVETWSGDDIQVTLAMIGAMALDEKSLDQPAQAKLEMFDAGPWNDYLAAQKAKFQSLLDQRYEASARKAKADL